MKLPSIYFQLDIPKPKLLKKLVINKKSYLLQTYSIMKTKEFQFSMIQNDDRQFESVRSKSVDS